MADDGHTLAIKFAAKFDAMQRDVSKNLGVILKKLEKQEVDAKKSFAKVEAAAGQAFGRMTGYVKSFVAAYASIAGVKMLAGFITSSLDAAAAIRDVSNEANASTDFIQEMRYALSQAGGTADDMDDALVKLNKALGEFRTTGGGPAKETLEQLGVAADVMAGRFATTDAAFDAIFAALSQVPSAADRAAMAADLFGKTAGPRLAELLANGTEGLRQAKQRARELGLVLSGEMIQAADDASDKLAELEQVISTKLTEAVVKLAPQIEELVNQIVEGLPGLLDWVRGWAEWLGIIERTPDRVEALVKKLQALQNNIDPTLGGLLTTALQARIDKAQNPSGLTGTGSWTGPMPPIDAGWDGTVTVTGRRPLHRGAAGNVGSAAGKLSTAADRLAALMEQMQADGRSISRDFLEQRLGERKAQLGKDVDAQAAIDAEIAQQAEDQKRAFTDAFVYALQSGDVKGAVMSFVNYFSERLYRGLADSIYDALFTGSKSGGGIGGLFSSLFGAIFGGSVSGGASGGASGIASAAGAFFGGRASGGPVTAGVPYVVGERQPELFVPRQSGYIVPQVPGGGMTFSPYIDARGASADAVAGIRKALADTQAEFRAWAGGEPKRVRGYVNNQSARGMIGAHG